MGRPSPTRERQWRGQWWRATQKDLGAHGNWYSLRVSRAAWYALKAKAAEQHISMLRVIDLWLGVNADTLVTNTDIAREKQRKARQIRTCAHQDCRHGKHWHVGEDDLPGPCTKPNCLCAAFKAHKARKCAPLEKQSVRPLAPIDDGQPRHVTAWGTEKGRLEGRVMYNPDE